MAITAWSAKVSSSLIWTGVKGRSSVRRAVRVADKLIACCRKGSGQKSAELPAGTHPSEIHSA